MTRRVGVVGWPIKHSRSPVIFGHWFERYGIDARYELIELTPEAAPAFFRALPEEWHGVNVTVPHKPVAAQEVAADEIGARLMSVNTLWRDGEIVRGTSSDGAGFVRSLDADAPGWRDAGQAVVLGAGGAAVAIVDALRREGLSVSVANRTLEKAEQLAERFAARAVSWHDAAQALDSASLLVNATALGMVGKPPLEIDLAALPRTAVVADIVYNPLETPLLAAGRARGNPCVDGLGMLMHQATVGFERWFGLVPEVDEALRNKVLATL